MADIWKIHPSNNSNKDGNYKIRKHWRWSFSNGAWLANTCGSESIFKLSQNSRLHLFVFHCAREHNELHLNIYNTPLMLIESSHTLPRTSPSLQLKPGAPKVHSDGWMTLERSKIALGLASGHSCQIQISRSWEAFCCRQLTVDQQSSERCHRKSEPPLKTSQKKEKQSIAMFFTTVCNLNSKNCFSSFLESLPVGLPQVLDGFSDEISDWNSSSWALSYSHVTPDSARPNPGWVKQRAE